jgi:hypothetical protein
LPRHPPRRRRRRWGNRGHAGGSTSSAVGPERIDDAGTPAGAMSDVVLAPETTTGVASPQRANPKRTDDASTLAKDLLGVSLVPEITVQSVPDATSPPSIDQKVPSIFHPVPFRFSFNPPSDPASVSAFARAYPDLPGYHMWSSQDRLTDVSTSKPAGSEEDDDSDFDWDFFGLSDPSVMRDFMSACDYCLSGCSNDGHSLGDEGCDPSRECFHIDQGDHGEDNHFGMPQDDNAPVPASRVDIPRELAMVPVPAGGQDTQLRQFREMQAKLDEEAGRLVQLRQNNEQEWAGRALAGGARHRAQDVQRPESSCSGDATPSDAEAVHHRGATYPGRTLGSLGKCSGPTSREFCLPKARVPLEASRNVLPTHAGGLGPHRALMGRDACSPESPRRRAPLPRPSSPPQKEGAPRLPPQARRTL